MAGLDTPPMLAIIDRTLGLIDDFSVVPMDARRCRLRRHKVIQESNAYG